jgi:pimeloyl-ACP methyl ester carboxylesterase
MGRLSYREVWQVDMAVVIAPDNGFEIVKKLKVPALGPRGQHDYVPEIAPHISIRMVHGGHISPLESPQEFQRFVQDVVRLDQRE